MRQDRSLQSTVERPGRQEPKEARGTGMRVLAEAEAHGTARQGKAESSSSPKSALDSRVSQVPGRDRGWEGRMPNCAASWPFVEQ
jgi:hypothetical protein